MSEKIITSFVHPPIPVRQFDWQAYFDGEEELGQYGNGRTEREAIEDLLTNGRLPCMERTGEIDHNNGCARCSAEVGMKCRAFVDGVRP